MNIYTIALLSCICIVIAFVIFIAIYLVTMKRHDENAKENYSFIIESFGKDNRGIVDMTFNREKAYYVSYFLYQLSGKAVNAGSVIFTVITLYASNIEINSYDFWAIFIFRSLSLMSTIFVIMAVYLNPIARAKDYLNAWRGTYEIVTRLLVDSPNLKEADRIKFLSKVKEDLVEIEKGLTTDET